MPRSPWPWLRTLLDRSRRERRDRHYRRKAQERARERQAEDQEIARRLARQRSGDDATA